MTVAYLDASAIVKTVIEEPETPRLVRWLTDWPMQTSCALVRTEVVRAVQYADADAACRARRTVAELRLISIDDALLDAAAGLPGRIRSLDAIHVAAARSLGPDLGALVTYDGRMADAARQLGVEVVAP